MRARPFLLCGILLSACGEPEDTIVYQAVEVERRDIVVSARAAGTIEPEVSVEVKSEAAGEILEILVNTGDVVEKGTLMVRIDQRQTRNALAQAEAELEVAQAGLRNEKSQRQRAEKLFKSKSISENEYDQAVLEYANAKAEVVRANVAVENARIEMEDTDIRAPIAGTIIEKHVERGQVISSPTQDVGGGTLLLKMADLSHVRVRALVDETDLGKIAPDLPATVTVAAYRNRPFEGAVLKIEPQAVTEQNVTMFPVLVSIDNPEGLLKPGMNCEVEFQVGRREQVLAIPNAALITALDVGAAASVLGLSPQELGDPLARGGSTTTDPDDPPVPQESSQEGVAAEEGAAAPSRDARFGGRYLVVVLKDGRPRLARIRTGLTDFDYSEVLEGLWESDSVLLLPSAGLVRSQEWRRDRINRITGGGLPGMRSRRP
jgi:HlyD family secretion protein